MGGLDSSQSSWELANLGWCKYAGSSASKPLLAQHFVLGGFRTLKRHFGSLLKKLLFLGRTLLLRLWVLGTHVRKRLGRLGEQPEQLEPVLVQERWPQG